MFTSATSTSSLLFAEAVGLRELIAQLRCAQVFAKMRQPLLERKERVGNRPSVRQSDVAPHAVRTRTQASALAQRATAYRLQCGHALGIVGEGILQ